MANAQGRAGTGLLERLKAGFSFGGKSKAIGLSVGASSVKIAELKAKKDGWTLEKFAAIQLPSMTSEQREILNPLSVTQAIQEIVKEAGISSKEVCSALVGSGLIIKNLTLVVTDMKELNDQVFWEAEQYIPFDISEVVVDYEITNKGKDNQVEVILIAVKKDFLEQYMSVIESANLVPKVMDAEVFALQNTYEANYPSSTTEAALLADVGALSTKIVICANGIPYFTKDASFGGQMITQEIQRDLNLPSANDAEALKVSGNLPHEVAEIVNRTSSVLGTEIKKAVDFYTASSLGPPIGKIWLTGGTAKTPHLAQTVQEAVQLPTEIMNTFEKIRASSDFSDEFLHSISADAAIPIGLAIRAGSK